MIRVGVIGALGRLGQSVIAEIAKEQHLSLLLARGSRQTLKAVDVLKVN